MKTLPFLPARRFLCGLALAMAVSTATGSAAVMIEGGRPDPLSIEITAPILLTVNVPSTGVSSVLLGFRDVFDVNHFFKNENPLDTPSDITLQLNGEPLVPVASLLAGVTPAMTIGPRDLFIVFNLGPTTISDGDIFTVSTGNLESNPTNFLSPDNVGPTVTVELFDNSGGAALTSPAVVATPEPSTTLLRLLAFTLVLTRRRRAPSRN